MRKRKMNRALVVALSVAMASSNIAPTVIPFSAIWCIMTINQENSNQIYARPSINMYEL